MLEDDRNCTVAEFDEAIDVQIELVNINTGTKEHAVVVNNHYAIVGLVQRFARRQHILPRAVSVHITHRSRV